MAHVKKNVVTEGLSGKLGNTIVFRNRGGKTVVSVTPEKKKRQLGETQRQQTRRFRQAVAYGKQALQDPSTKAAYQARTKNGQSAFNVAVADYLNAPNMDEPDFSSYQGARGSQLLLPVVDDHLVTEVTVALYNKAGALVEEGPAILHDNGVDRGTSAWVYTTQRQNADVAGSKLVVRASDLPGNTLKKEVMFA